MRFEGLGAWLLLATVLAGCASPEPAELEIGDLATALAADPHGGRFLLFNFTLYNNGSVEATEIQVSIDGLNRTPPDTNHYGRAERSLQRLPAGESFVIKGQLDVYATCQAYGPEASDCANGTTYFTIRADPANGPEVVKLVKDESGYF